MTRFNTKSSFQFTLLNFVMASSSSVQFKWYLCNQVNNITGNEVSQTKKARGECSKEPKLNQKQGTKTKSVTEWREKPWEKPGSVNIEWPVTLQPDEPVVCSNYRKIRLNNSFKKRSQAYTQIKHSANCILDRSVQMLRKTRWAWALYWGLKSRSWLETHRP